MKIIDVNAISIKDVTNQELLNLHLRCHQLFNNFTQQKPRNLNIEDIVNAHHLIVAEMERRGLRHNLHDPLDESLRKIQHISVDIDEPPKKVIERIENLPEELVVVKDFISLVGSAIKIDEANDLDILFRTDIKDGYCLIRYENVWVPIRLAIDPEKELKIHFIGNPQGAITDNIPIYDLILKKRGETRIQSIGNKFKKAKEKIIKYLWKKEELKPITRFQMAKPRMATYAHTEAFSADEIWPWVEDHLKNGVVAENKLNGVHTCIQKNGDQIEIYFEDKQEDFSKKFPEIVEILRGVDDDFIIDCDLGVLYYGERWERIRLMAFMGEQPELPENAYPIFTVWDILYTSELPQRDIHILPFEKRRKILEKFYEKHLKDNKYFQITEQIPIKTKKDLIDAFNKFSNNIGSEGIMLKDMKAPYKIGPQTDDLAKIKKIVEIKVIVLDRKQNKNGTYSYTGGVLLGDMHFDNTTKLKDEKYVNLGSSFNAPFKAEIGDILTVTIEELIIRSDDKGIYLSWFAPRPIDIDPTREKPYFAAQIIEMCNRAKILQDVRENQQVKLKNLSLVNIDDNIAKQLLKADWTVNKQKYFSLLDYQPISNVMRAYRLLYIHYSNEWGLIGAIGGYHKLKKEINKTEVKEAINKLNGKSATLNNYLRVLSPIKKRATPREEEDEETRGERAAKFWAENWYKCYPNTGKGRFVVHNHWRGLTEEETKLSHDELLETDHSMHSDMRFSFNDALWGFTVFTGNLEENKKWGGCSLNGLDSGINLQGIFKLTQPKEWLTVANKKPFIVEPFTGIGSTALKWAKYFEWDSGTYEIGVWREHMIELFLNGEKLKGRYIIEYAPLGDDEKRKWIIDKPEDQTPYADKKDLEEVVNELKQKGQKYLIWGKPGSKPEFIEVNKFKAKINEKRYEIDISPSRGFDNINKIELNSKIIKTDDEHRFVLCPALVPNKPDKQSEIISADEIEKAAHTFMADYQTMKLLHKGQIPKSGVSIVESYILRNDTIINNIKLKRGTWMVGLKIWDDELWQLIKEGKLNGLSIGGYCLSC